MPVIRKHGPPPSHSGLGGSVAGPDPAAAGGAEGAADSQYAPAPEVNSG